jgi:uncharacterized protein (TIGR02611 family)
VRKLFVFVAGWFLVLVGLAFLPLPGPGWAIIFLGFAVLATEFAFAAKTKAWLVEQLKRFINSLKRLIHKRPLK